MFVREQKSLKSVTNARISEVPRYDGPSKGYRLEILKYMKEILKRWMVIPELETKSLEGILIQEEKVEKEKWKAVKLQLSPAVRLSRLIASDIVLDEPNGIEFSNRRT